MLTPTPDDPCTSPRTGACSAAPAELVNLLDVLTADRELPEGCNSWGIKSVHADLMTTHGYTWPLPGNWATCDPGHISRYNTGACPVNVGDGLCVATTWAGMASGGISASGTLLLVAYRPEDVLGAEPFLGKLRASAVLVVAMVDGSRLVREHGERAYLYGADLRGADLHGADLRGANLHGADLHGADLYGADLSGADLSGADLRGANLHGADLHGADLSGANLRGVDLRGANLRGVDLFGADLRGANLRGVDLTGVDLTGANLSGWVAP